MSIILVKRVLLVLHGSPGYNFMCTCCIISCYPDSLFYCCCAHVCLILLLFFNFHYISVCVRARAYYIAIVCIFLITLHFSPQKAYYVAVLSMSASLDYNPLYERFITFFVVFMSHHLGVLSMYASLHCACHHICLNTLQSSPYELHHVVLLSIYTIFPSP
jgi:hypothetical protein